jgi:hypothetical protein
MAERKPVLVRLTDTGIAAIDRLAKLEGVSRSEMLRRLIADGYTQRIAKGTL